MRLLTLAIAASFIMVPAAFTTSLAQSSGGGSEIPKATTRSAFPGPRIDGAGNAVLDSTRPNSGIGGGGMSSEGGIKAGGEDRNSALWRANRAG
jgi:hypothetical protein